MGSWLKCDEVGEGMLPGEYAVVTRTFEGRPISLFVSEENVEQSQQLLRVMILSSGGGNTLIYLPSEPLGSSRTVKVSSAQVVART